MTTQNISLKLRNDIDWDFHSKFNSDFRVKTSQNLTEMDQFLSWIKNNCALGKSDIPFKYLEIGSYAGESIFYISQVLPRDTQMSLVDLGDNLRAREILERVIPYLDREYGMHITLYSGDSRDRTIIEKIKAKQEFDLGFIDANHEFNFALNDYKNYRPFCKTMAFHDISEFSIEANIQKHGLDKANAAHLWQAIKLFVPENKIFEFVDTRTDFKKEDGSILKPRGIGVITQ